VDRRDATPAPPFSTAVNSRVGQRKAGPNQVREMRELRRSPREIVMPRAFEWKLLAHPGHEFGLLRREVS
jgi:hypothetical protein